MDWYLMVWKKFAEFGGRSRRTEYWMFTLFNFIAYIVLFAAAISLKRAIGVGIILMLLYLVYALAGIIPSLAVSVRRLHDTGKSGWWLLISFIPLVGAIVMLFFLVSDSEPGPNVYGPNPKLANQSAGII